MSGETKAFDHDLRMWLRVLDTPRLDPCRREHLTGLAVPALRKRGGHYDMDNIRYVARGEELYRTLPT